MKRVRWTMLVVASLLTACGDPDTNDDRGYTKAPLENPGWLIEGEPESRMAELGEPDRIPQMSDDPDEAQTQAQDSAQEVSPAAAPAADTGAAAGAGDAS